MLLEISSLSCGFPEKRLFKDCNLCLYAGDKVAIMGPNGIGKTSLLRTIIGLHPPLKGQVKFGRGQQYSRRELGRLIGYIPQATEVYPDLLSFQFFEDLDSGLSKELIQSLALQDLLGRPFRLLSGGEKQRVILASTLARQPKIILADELTQGVDQDFSMRFADCLNKYIAKNSAAMLIVTHDFQWAKQYCSKRYLLTPGGLANE